MLKFLKSRGIWSYLSALTLFAMILRFFGLESAMPGFYVDESAIATQILCIRQTGANAWGEILPLFSTVLGGGTLSPTYTYSGVVWTTLFGDSITSYRTLPAFYSIALIVGLYRLSMILFRDQKAALFVALAASLSPWGFQFARISWDPGIAPCFLIWSCVFTLHAERRWHAILAGALMSLAMYTYPPVRLHAVLLTPFLIWLKFSRSSMSQSRLKTIELTALAFLSGVLVGLPLIVLTLQGGDFSARANMLSIFSEYYMLQFGGFSYTRALKVFTENMTSFFSLKYLIFNGDGNLRHSSQSFGILSALDIFAIVLSVFVFRPKSINRDQKLILTFLIAGYLTGLVPASLTWQGNPHSLRSFSAEPFLALFVGWSLFRLWQKRAALLPVISILATATLASLAFVYFAVYPVRASAWFDQEIATIGKQPKSDEQWAYFMNPNIQYPALSRQYYLMAYGTGICVPKTPQAQ